MLKEIIKKNRTFRRFYQDYKIPDKTLIELIDLARLSSSPRNQQALKFIPINSEELNSEVFKLLSWAGALTDWKGAEEGERPSAYIIILEDRNLIPPKSKSFNDMACGIVAQSITLGAVEKNIGGCMVAAIQKNKLKKLLNLSEQFEILLVIALGKPKEEIILEKMPKNGDFNYWRDDNNIHHVPKRELDEIITKI